LFLNVIDNDIAELTRNAQKSRTSSQVEVIQSEFRAFSSQVGQLLSYAQTQDAFGAFLVSLGSNPVPDDYQTRTVNDLSNALDEKFKIWEQGQLEIIDPDKMQQRIDERKAKETDAGLIDTFLETPVELPPIEDAFLKPKLPLKRSVIECTLDEKLKSMASKITLTEK